MDLSVSVAPNARTVRRSLVMPLIGLFALVAGQLGAGAALAAPAPAPSTTGSATSSAAPLKAVIIVGPTNSLTDSNLADAESLALTAESYGMDVHRVFFPHATWENVLANIQGANLVVYMGHGYGWPSPYTNVLTESRQDGMGLNTFDGSGKNQYTYYGANLIRDNITLAPNAIVFLNHLCYSAGNGEPGMAIPSWDLARQRVDNMASGWLAVGARVVFAYASQLFNKMVKLLFTTDDTMEDMFKTPGAKNFLDPHQTEGFYRAISGDLGMTTSDWSAGSGGGAVPTLTHLQASPVDGGAFLNGGPDDAMFTPNGDGVTDDLNITYNVDAEAFVDFEVKNSSGGMVRSFSGWSPAGTGSADWDGKNDNGDAVGDDTYTIKATPRNRGGEAGASKSVDVVVLTTMYGPAVSPDLFYPSDGDNLAQTTALSVTLQQAATFTWKVVDGDGNTVKTKVNNASVGAGTQNWNWDGKDGSGNYVPDGTYYSVMTATTSAGSYSHKLPVDVMAFRMTTKDPAPFVRGTKTKVYVWSAEPLYSKPKVKLFAPGVSVKKYRTYNLAGGGYYVKVTFPGGAQPGTLHIQVVSKDVNGVKQWTDYYFPLL